MVASVGKTSRACHVSLPVGILLVLLVASEILATPATTAATATTAMTAAVITTATMPTAATLTSTTKPRSSTVTDYILPNSVYPLHYNLELQPYMHDPDPHKFTFKGTVNILMGCFRETDIIILHVDVLTVDPSSIRFYSETPSTPTDPKYVTFEEDKVRQFFIVRLDKNMEPEQNYWIEMTFTSPLMSDVKGMYYGQYTRDSQTIYLAATQFQPTHARKAFPCFDEPAMKATFNITIVRPADRMSLSNMPLDNSDITFEENGVTYVKDVYKQTPLMSTYLVAFVVCDFSHLADATTTNVTMRTWATPESVNDTRYALDVGVNITEYFEDYFEIKYSLPKQDSFVVPEYELDAMENWGLIIYKESDMMYKKGVSTEEEKDRVTRVVSHETAHQWFGNLVTPLWWSDLWLSEGFTSYFEHVGVGQVHPDWRTFEYFIIDKLQPAFAFDVWVFSHPVYNSQVEKTPSINNMFSVISYRKGASLVRMMNFFLGESTFRKGIINYLKKWWYNTAGHDDLWEELAMQAKSDGLDINVKDIMDTWVSQTNFPVVTVMRDFNVHNMLYVTQERFLADPTAKLPTTYKSPYNYRWSIPLTFTSSEDLRFNHSYRDVQWMYKDEFKKTFHVDILLADCNDTDGWILANVQQYGYYRVNYAKGNWLALTRQLKRNHLVIPAVNRAQIISDAWNLAKANHIPVSTALETVAYLHKEHDYIPWYTALHELSFVNSMLSLTSLYGAFKHFMQHELSEPLTHFMEKTIARDHMDVLTWSLLAEKSCYYGVLLCDNNAKSQYQLWMDNSSHNPIDPNIRKAVYCTAIAKGSWREWSFALKMYREVNTPAEADRLVSAMACSKQPWILNHFLNMILETDSPFRQKHADDIVATLIKTHNGRYLAWDFYRVNYKALKAKYASFECRRVLVIITEFFNTELELKEVMDFRNSECQEFKDFTFGLVIVERIKNNIKWLKTNLPIIKDWIKDRPNPFVGQLT